MMKKCFEELDLPIPTINDVENVMKNRKRNFGYNIHLQPEEILCEEALNKFSKIGVTPGYIVLFTNLFVGDMSNRWTHSDVRTIQDPRTLEDMRNVEWKSCSSGINFELYNNENIFNWYETTDETVPLMPVIENFSNVKTAWLAGIHYGAKRNLAGVPSSLRHVASKNIGNIPTLVRTDIPHNTTFLKPTNSTHRVGASIRFYEDWSWEETLEIFKPLFKK